MKRAAQRSLSKYRDIVLSNSDILLQLDQSLTRGEIIRITRDVLGSSLNRSKYLKSKHYRKIVYDEIEDFYRAYKKNTEGPESSLLNPGWKRIRTDRTLGYYKKPLSGRKRTLPRGGKGIGGGWRFFFDGTIWHVYDAFQHAEGKSITVINEITGSEWIADTAEESKRVYSELMDEMEEWKNSPEGDSSAYYVLYSRLADSKIEYKIVITVIKYKS